MYVSVAVRHQVWSEADSRCGYCQSHQQFLLSTLEVEHIIPSSKGGSSEASNLWLACRRCNNSKAAQVSAPDPISGTQITLFNPRLEKWSDHFQWSSSGTFIIDLTPTGRATVEALQLNEPHAVTVRGNWVKVGWHPPQ